MNRENRPLCVVFPMGMEAYPFLRRVEVRNRRTRNRTVYRNAFFEGRLLSVVKCGVGPERAADAVRHLNEEPSAIVCAGTAGALVEDLTIRDIVISGETVFGDVPGSVLVWPDAFAEAAVRACVAEGLSHRLCRVATVRQAVFHRKEREQLHAATGAVAVDMESHALGIEARKLGIPFVAIRVISDDIDSLGPTAPQRPATFLRRPGEITRHLMARYRTRIFMKKFRSAIDLLHPVLVRLIRNSDYLPSLESARARIENRPES